MKVYDAEDKVLGRLATKIAKDLLAGEEVRVVNAEKAIITGKREDILSEFRARRDRGKQRKGPFYPSRPERIFKRTVRGMLPYQQPKGRNAYRNLRAYIGIPSEFKDAKIIEDNVKSGDGMPGVTLEKVSRHLGAKF